MKAPSLNVRGEGPLRGVIRVPGDKSVTHRALIFAALAEGTSEITNPSTATDCLSTAGALMKLGARVTARGKRLLVRGTGERGFSEPDSVLDLGNSGTGLRLLAGAIASREIFAVLDGDASLRNRPVDRIISPLSIMGARLWARRGDRYPPLAVRGGRLAGIDYRSPVASAQVKSAVLLAALGAEGTTHFFEPKLSRDHTERLLPSFGVRLERGPSSVILRGPQSLSGASVAVPGDISSAAFWVVAALIVPGSRLTVRGVGLNPTRTGYLEILRHMGGDVAWKVTGEPNGEPVGEIAAAHSPLAGVAVTAEMVPACIDELPILSVAAAAARGTTIVSGAGELRVKESDRIRAMATQLAAMGARVTETSDGLVIDGGAPLRGGTVESFGDHRVAMSLAVAGLIARGRTVIRDTANIGTSYPEFEATLVRLTRHVGQSRS